MSKVRPQKMLLVFYRSSVGTEPVRDWIKALDSPDRFATPEEDLNLAYKRLRALKA